MASPVISNPKSFWEEARYQQVCARCEKGGQFHAHHVVAQNWLKQRHLPEYDTRNALRLCVRCHMQFEWAGPGKIQVETRQLTQDNICYIFAIMAGAGVDYLQREYTGADDRWWLHAAGECTACQR